MNNRFICEPKRQFRSEEFSVVLVHSEPRRGASYALSDNKNEPLIYSQLRSLKKVFGENVDIVVVSGYKTAELEIELKRKVRIVTNELFEQTDMAHSIYLGIKATTSQAIYVIDGSLVFDDKVFRPKLESHVYTDDSGEVGLIIENNKIVSVSYGLDGIRLGKIMYLCKNDVTRFIKFYSSKLLFSEVLNLMIDDGMNLEAIK